MKNSYCIVLLLSLCYFSSCHLSYRVANHYIPLKDSIRLSDSYTMYVRKLAYDMQSDGIVLSNEAVVDTSQFKVIEIEYLFYQPETKKAILISYLPSYYYALDKTNRGGLYSDIVSDSSIYLNQIRRIMFLSATDHNVFGLGNYNFTYEIKEANDLEREQITFTEAIDRVNTYLTGTIHIGESVRNSIQFDRRESFDIRQFIPKLGDTILPQQGIVLQNKKIPSNRSARRGIADDVDAIRLYILDRNHKKGIVFKLPDGKNLIFGKSRTNWFGKKG